MTTILSAEHPVGRFKAGFFGSLGYSRQNWQQLQYDLQQMARSDGATLGQVSEFGRKYEVRATVQGPSGRATIVTVWIVLEHEDFPRLITAFPGEAR